MKRVISLSGLTNERKYKKGQSILSSSSINSPHIVKIINYLVSAGLDRKKLISQVEQFTQRDLDCAKIAPNMYTGIAQNSAESAVFNALWKSDIEVTGAPKLSGITLKALFYAVQVENKQFFPLRDFVKMKTLRGMPNLIPVPSPSYPKFSNVDTACITPKGDIFFSSKFAQKLIDYAYLKGVKPKKKKYVCNGGDIPDEYCYIEFVIMHELLHYSYGDFYFDKILKATAREINYAGDYRSNYKLVASGYEQIPIGLFSDTINYDVQEKYKDMIDIIREETKKLRDANQEENEHEQDQHTDSKGETRESDDQQGSGSGGDGEEDDEDSGGGSGSPEDSDEDGEEGSGKNSKAGDTSKIGKDEGDIDSRAKEVDEEMSKSKDSSSDEIKESKEKDNNAKKIDRSKLSNNGNDGSKQEIDISKVEPKFNWRQIIKRAVMKAENDTEESYAKIHRSSITRVKLAVEQGEAATKPGERLREHFKFALVIDSSGSMSHIIAQVFAEFTKLLKSTDLSGECLLYKFSDVFDIFVINTKTKSAYHLNRQTRKKGAKTTIGEALYHFGAGTDFSDALRKELEHRIDEGYNVLIASDSDILWTGNKENLMKLVKKAKRNVFVVLDSRNTYEMMLREIDLVTPRNVTYWSE